MYCCPCLRLQAHLTSRDYITFDLKLSFNVIGLSMCYFLQDKTCKFFLPRFVITQVMNLLNGIWRHHLLSNNVGQNSCPLDNIHFKFSVICVRFMYKYLTLCYIFFLFNLTPFVFFKDISCLFLSKHSCTCNVKVQQTSKFWGDI